MDVGLLENLGLTRNEAKVYVRLLDESPAQLSYLLEKTDVSRRGIYDVIESLSKKGLVSVVQKDGKKYYAASNPKRLYEIVREKEQFLDALMPDLLKRQGSFKEKQGAMVYTGKKGIKTVFDMMIDEGKEIFVIGGQDLVYETLKDYFHRYKNKRTGKGLTLNILFRHDAHYDIQVNQENANIRFLPKEFRSPVSTVTFGDKTAINIWVDPMSILIKSQKVADGFVEYFRMLWDISSERTKK